jgi:hypothetical protein
MTDIYQHKARKYKLKYLKLIKDFVGGSNNDIHCLAIRPIEKDDFTKLKIETIYGNPIYSSHEKFPIDKKKNNFYDT